MIFDPPKSVERCFIFEMTGGVGGGKLSWLRLRGEVRYQYQQLETSKQSGLRNTDGY